MSFKPIRYRQSFLTKCGKPIGFGLSRTPTMSRIRREVEGDYRLPSGERMDQADCVMVVEIAEGVRFRSGVTIVPFSPLWQVLHIGRDYDDDDFIPEVKDMFQSFPKPQGAWKAFKKHRAAKARRQ